MFTSLRSCCRSRIAAFFFFLKRVADRGIRKAEMNLGSGFPVLPSTESSSTFFFPPPPLPFPLCTQSEVRTPLRAWRIQKRRIPSLPLDLLSTFRSFLPPRGVFYSFYSGFPLCEKTPFFCFCSIGTQALFQRCIELCSSRDSLLPLSSSPFRRGALFPPPEWQAFPSRVIESIIRGVIFYRLPHDDPIAFHALVGLHEPQSECRDCLSSGTPTLRPFPRHPNKGDYTGVLFKPSFFLNPSLSAAATLVFFLRPLSFLTGSILLLFFFGAMKTPRPLFPVTLFFFFFAAGHRAATPPPFVPPSSGACLHLTGRGFFPSSTRNTPVLLG